MYSSKQITKISLLTNGIKKKFAVKVPTATDARTMGATCAARNLGTRENNLLSAQMSHNMEVHAQYYAAVRGRREAAEAAIVLEILRHGEHSG